MEIVKSPTGGTKEVKLARHSLIPTTPLWLLAEAYGKGLLKYPTPAGELDNWRLGYEWSKAYDSIQHHLNQFWAGEEVDEETGNLHLIAAVFHAFSLIEWSNDPLLRSQYDDRQDNR